MVCKAMVRPKSMDMKRQLAVAFRTFGMPLYMLSDEASTSGPARLELAVVFGRRITRPTLIARARCPS